jgi:hypothetical protein
MRVARIISFLLLLYTANVAADLGIRYDVITQGKHQPYYSILIKRDMVRIERDYDSAQTLLVNLRSGDIVQLDNPSQHFFSINAQTIDQYVSFYKQNRSLLQGLIDQGITQLSERQRAQLDEVIQAYKTPAQQNQFNVHMSKKRQQVLGVDCNVLTVMQKTLLKSNICVSDYQQLGLNPEDIHSLQKLQAFVQQFRNSAPQQYQALFDLLSQGPAQINGLPMQMVTYRADGKVSYVIQAGAISFRSIPEWKYQIPPGFEPSTYPVM